MAPLPHHESTGTTFLAGELFQDTTRIKIPPGKLSRRARALQLKTVRTDTAQSPVGVISLDSLRAMPRDSSARLANFKYVRKDRPQVQPNPQKTYTLFLADPQLVKVQHLLDSLDWRYRIRQTEIGRASCRERV